MQRRYLTALSILALVLGISAPARAGDPASAELKKGYQAAKRGYWNEAMARYKNATLGSPNNAEIWSNLGVALEAVGQYEEAGEAYRRALEIDPTNQKIHRNYGLYNQFYMSYILVPEEEEEIEITEEEQEEGGKAVGDEGEAEEKADNAAEKGAPDASRS